jgi:hypothetical protein
LSGSPQALAISDVAKNARPAAHKLSWELLAQQEERQRDRERRGGREQRTHHNMRPLACPAAVHRHGCAGAADALSSVG